jgi:hypothetical protein
MLAHAIVTTPEMIGVVAWWSVVLTAPVILVRRWRRRGLARHPTRRRRRGPSVTRGARRAAKPMSAPLAADPATSEPSGAGIEPVVEAYGALVGALFDQRVRSMTALAVAGRQAACSPPAVAMSERLSAGTLEPLCRYVDFRRRLEAAAAELEAQLRQLPAARWRIEPYPLTGERRNTLLIVGETGIFVISATYAPGHWDDVIAVSKLARKIQLLLPGYRAQVQPALCHPFAATSPRIWHRPDEHGEWVGAWLIGGDSVIQWLEHFGSEHGLNASDLARFDALSKPNWLEGAIPAPPSWPPIHEAGWPDSRE